MEGVREAFSRLQGPRDGVTTVPYRNNATPDVLDIVVVKD
jgi:hypothetical protein